MGTTESIAAKVDPKVREMLAQLPHKNGYALVVDAETDGGELLERLVAMSDFQAIALVNDAESAGQIRARLAGKNLYGRAVVHEIPDYAALPYVENMFNLVTSPRGLAGAEFIRHPDFRKHLRPGSGAAFFSGSAKPSYRAAKLDGIGDWTHMYADPGNTACSNDTRVGTQLALQWFGRPGPQHMVDRHLRAAPPVVKNGYMFVPGRDYLFGLDAWNGAVLWEREVPEFRRIGALRDSGNLVATNEFLYCASADRCLLLEPTTGKEVLSVALPKDYDGGTHEWGYSAVVGGKLVGSAVKKGSIYREMSSGAIYEFNYGDKTAVTCSDCLFAKDRMTGAAAWRHDPAGSIVNPSICVSESEVFFIESGNPGTLKGDSARLDYPALVESHGAFLVCLALQSGKETWRKKLALRKGIQTLFVLSKNRKVVIANSRNAVATGAKKQTLHYDVVVLDAREGNALWSDTKDFKARTNLDHGEQDRHPAIVGERLIVEPHIYDLATGDSRGEFRRRGGGCGTIAASANSLYYRAGNPAAFDLSTGSQQSINKVSRPGCWINMIPAGGLLLVPEGSSGCICNYPIQGSMAYAPR